MSGLPRFLPSWSKDLAIAGPRGMLAWQAVTSAVGLFHASALLALYLAGPAGLRDRAVALTLLGSAALCLVATPGAGRVIRAWGPRRFAIVSCLSRGILFMILPASLAPLWTVTVVLLIGLCEAAAFSVYQLIIVEALGAEARTQALAVRRALGNVGFTVAGLGVAVVVSIGNRGAYGVGFVVSGAFLTIAALLLFPLPDAARPTPTAVSPEGRGRRVALRDARFVGLIAVASVMASSLQLLTVGVPLWVVRATAAPHGVVGALLVINTVLVVAFQVRLSRGSGTWAGARHAVVLAGVAFAFSATLVALAGALSAWGAVTALASAAVVAAVAEMWDSAGWWTLSYEYAGADERPDYLAAFDVVTPLVNIAGPPLMIAIVAVGAWGWCLYATLFLICSMAASKLVGTRPARRPEVLTH